MPTWKRACAGEALPLLFGRGVRDRTLLLLHANGPLQQSQIVRALLCDEKKVFRALQHFEGLGVVAKRGRPGHRVHWTIDRRFVAYDELSRLLRGLGRLWFVPIMDVPIKRQGGPNFRVRPDHDPSISRLFGSEMRSRILLAIARYEPSSITNLASLTGSRYESVHYCVKSLAAQGAVSTARRGRDVLVTLDQSFIVHEELRALLLKLARYGTL